MFKKVKERLSKLSKKRYYIPGVDEFHQMVETPASKERTDFHRYLVTLTVSSVSAIAAIVAAIVAILTYIKV